MLKGFLDNIFSPKYNICENGLTVKTTLKSIWHVIIKDIIFHRSFFKLFTTIVL